jgi:DNA-binding protein HU-beta
MRCFGACFIENQIVGRVLRPGKKKEDGKKGRTREERKRTVSAIRVERKYEEMDTMMGSRIQIKDIAEKLARKMNASDETAEEWIDALIEVLYESFKKGRSVTLQGLGGFYLKPKGKTWVFKFNPSQRLRHLFGWASTYKGNA